MLMKSRRRTPVSAGVSAVDCSVVAIPIPCVTRCSGKPRATRNTGLPPGVAPPDSRERHKMPTAYFCFLLHGRPRPMRYGHAHRLAGAGYCGKSRSEEHTSELQSLMRISYAVFCLKNKITYTPLPDP